MSIAFYTFWTNITIFLLSIYYSTYFCVFTVSICNFSSPVKKLSKRFLNISFFLQANFCTAAAGGRFGDNDLTVDLLLEFGYMRDDTYQTISFRQAAQGLHSLCQ